MSANSWREIAETMGMDVRECAKKVEKLEGQICLSLKNKEKKSDHNKERGPRREKSPSV